MGRVRVSALLASALLLFTGWSASAADIPEPPFIAPPPIKVGHSWYLRGHIGMSNQHFDTLEHTLFDGPAFFEWLDRGQFDAAPTFGVGIGIRAKNWLRFDVIGEWRGKASFAAQDRYDSDNNPPIFTGTSWGVNDYTAKKSEWLLMANAYADLGSWHGLTPYVGAGLGASYNIITNFRDNNIIQSGGGEAGTGGMWNLAWALHAGVDFRLNQNVVVDFGYSFLSLGDAKTGILTNLNGICTACEPMYFRNLVSHDLRVAFRYEFDKAYGKVPSWPTPAVVKY